MRSNHSSEAVNWHQDFGWLFDFRKRCAKDQLLHCLCGPVLFKPNVVQVILFNFWEQKFVEHGTLTLAIERNGGSLFIFERNGPVMPPYQNTHQSLVVGPVRRWALNDIEMSRFGKKRNREWNFGMHFNSKALKGIPYFHSRFRFFPHFYISMPTYLMGVHRLLNEDVWIFWAPNATTLLTRCTSMKPVIFLRKYTFI